MELAVLDRYIQEVWAEDFVLIRTLKDPGHIFRSTDCFSIRRLLVRRFFWSTNAIKLSNLGERVRELVFGGQREQRLAKVGADYFWINEIVLFQNFIFYASQKIGSWFKRHECVIIFCLTVWDSCRIGWGACIRECVKIYTSWSLMYHGPQYHCLFELWYDFDVAVLCVYVRKFMYLTIICNTHAYKTIFFLSCTLLKGGGGGAKVL